MYMCILLVKISECIALYNLSTNVSLSLSYLWQITSVTMDAVEYLINCSMYTN